MKNEMANELESKLIEYLEKTAGSIEKILDFGAEQTPLLIKEFLNYGFWSTLISLIITTFGFVICAFYCKKYCKEITKIIKRNGDPVLEAIVSFGFGMIALIFFVYSYCNIQTMLKISIAPKIYVIEQIREQISPKTCNGVLRKSE